MRYAFTAAMLPRLRQLPRGVIFFSQAMIISLPAAAAMLLLRLPLIITLCC